MIIFPLSHSPACLPPVCVPSIKFPRCQIDAFIHSSILYSTIYQRCLNSFQDRQTEQCKGIDQRKFPIQRNKEYLLAQTWIPTAGKYVIRLPIKQSSNKMIGLLLEKRVAFKWQKSASCLSNELWKKFKQWIWNMKLTHPE